MMLSGFKGGASPLVVCALPLYSLSLLLSALLQPSHRNLRTTGAAAHILVVVVICGILDVRGIDAGDRLIWIIPSLGGAVVWWIYYLRCDQARDIETG
jgi:hypothetical protein